MYPLYIEGCDIVSYDIYPVTSKYDHIRNNLWYVADGIDNLREWSEDDKPAWCWIETTHISSENKPTPSQVKAEVWMALIHGAKGFGYFCHEWIPAFNSNALLDDPVMFPAVTGINKQIHQLAPVLNAPDKKDLVSVSSSNSSVPVDILVKHYHDTLYVFAVAMRDGTTTATFTVNGVGVDDADVIGEERSVTVSGTQFEDSFAGYEVHLYKMQYLNTAVNPMAEETIEIFPNPGSEYLTISSARPVENCTLINMSGQVVSMHGITENRIDIRSCEPGIYMLCLWINDIPFHHKIIIEN